MRGVDAHLELRLRHFDGGELARLVVPQQVRMTRPYTITVEFENRGDTDIPVPLLIVNASNIDPVQNQADYDELVGAIRRMKKGRMYYNPLRHGTI